ncbi:transposase [Thermosynechococcus sp.]|uniref:transposase n=1 Tax=Thermosynechococcus sp. TaxID=2814275 RepID=UPI002636B8BB|nr:transposase [Thermosynechococcus sp.]
MTICTQGRACLFGQVVEGQMRLNEFGEIVAQTWYDLPNHIPNVALDACIVMPNHMHGIIVITDASPQIVGAIHELPLHELPLHELPLHELPLQSQPHQQLPQHERRRMLLPKIIGRFKMASAKGINKIRNTPGIPVWQRNYYEHIIRTEDALQRIRQYIVTNPLRWHLDRENPNPTGRNPDEEMWFGSA